MSFLEFSKRFSHFVISPVFLSFIEVSDYLEIRQGCRYLHDCYDYSVLEDLVKFGNLDDILRKNLWMNVCPIIPIQRKYRENLQQCIKEQSIKCEKLSSSHRKRLDKVQSDFNLGSVYWNVYDNILEHAGDLDYFIEKIDAEVSKFRKQKEQLEIYEPDDFDVLRNLALAFNFLFPEDANEKLAYLDALFQGSRDEEVSFWILLCMMEKLKAHKATMFRKMTDVKTLELLTQKHSPNFYKLMYDTKQLHKVCENMINSFGWCYFEFYQSLPLIDSYLVCGWKGFYERILIVFQHLEALLIEWAEEDTNSTLEPTNSKITTNSNTRPNVMNEEEPADSYRLASIREYFHFKSEKSIEFDISDREELSFPSLVEIVENFSKSYFVSISDKDLQETRKLALQKVVEEATTPPDDELDREKYIKIKSELKATTNKYMGDIQTIQKKAQNVIKHIECQREELSDVESTFSEQISYLWYLFECEFNLILFYRQLQLLFTSIWASEREDSNLTRHTDHDQQRNMEEKATFEDHVHQQIILKTCTN